MPFFCNRKLGTVKSIHRKEYRELLDALAKARKDKGMTQQQLAKKLKRPQSYISKFENGERRLDIIELLEICKSLNIELSKILKEAVR